MSGLSDNFFEIISGEHLTVTIRDNRILNIETFDEWVSRTNMNISLSVVDHVRRFPSFFLSVRIDLSYFSFLFHTFIYLFY